MWHQTQKIGENETIRKSHYHVTEVYDKAVHHNLTYQLTSSILTKKNNMMHPWLSGNYHIHWDPLLGVGHQAVIIFWDSCIDKIKSKWVEGKEPAE